MRFDQIQADYPIKPPFRKVQIGDSFEIWDEEHVWIEDITLRNEQNADWLVEALNEKADSDRKFKKADEVFKSK